MKKIVRLSESDLTRIVKRIVEENKKEDSMEYFKSRGNEIQKSVMDAVNYIVNPIRIRVHSNYFKQVVDYSWMRLKKDENTPSKREFVKFMKKYFGDQILSHHQGLSR